MPILTAIVGILFYAVLYTATSKKQFCDNFNYTAYYKVVDSATNINGHLYNGISGINCDMFEISLIQANQQQYATVGDSICNYAAEVGFPLKSVMVIMIDTVLRKADTLYTKQCP